jgi:hypothetical protein
MIKKPISTLKGRACSLCSATTKDKSNSCCCSDPAQTKYFPNCPFVDPHEEPEKTMQRELMEETGYKGNVKFMTTCFDDVGSTGDNIVSEQTVRKWGHKQATTNLLN